MELGALRRVAVSPLFHDEFDAQELREVERTLADPSFLPTPLSLICVASPESARRRSPSQARCGRLCPARTPQSGSLSPQLAPRPDPRRNRAGIAFAINAGKPPPPCLAVGVLCRCHPSRATTEPAPSRQLLPCAWSRATKPSRRPPAEPSCRPPLDRDPTDPIHQNQARSEPSLAFLQKRPSV